MAPGSWDFSHNLGPNRCVFSGDDLTIWLKAGNRRVFRRVAFTDCDFQGYFSHSAQLVFDDCIFVGCDFGLSTWTNVKFSKCAFKRVSFGQTKFDNCEFRTCDWEDIGISPNALELTSTYFSSSAKFIGAAATNLSADILAKNGVTVMGQGLRLEVTKATVARRVLKMLQEEGDEIAFYDAVKTFQLQHCVSGRATAILVLTDSKELLRRKVLSMLSICSWTIEGLILRTFGAASGWGATVTRPALFSIFNLAMFALIYQFLCSPTKQASSIQRAFDISIIAGYTNYGAESDTLTVCMQNMQIFLSSVLCAITFATIINRLSRVR